ncbi:unnamed protein product [Sphagnum jensenii]|uniref:Nuclear condensin complex subunit 3 C-terminal domain-containing protein n=1 Tax=Sphagnum jensenii TaxID=128206 RepID=A0ABP0VGH3_9BRYO
MPGKRGPKKQAVVKISTVQDEVTSSVSQERLTQKLREIFNAAQHLPKVNGCIKVLHTLFRETLDEKAFLSEFCRNTRFALQGPDKCPFTRCSIDFVVRFLVAIVKEDEKTEAPAPQVDETADDIGMELFGEDSFESKRPVSKSQLFVDKVLLEVVVKFLNCVEPNVRVNACVFLKKLLMDIEEIDLQVFEKLKNSLIDRMADKCGPVRVAAAYALRRFQECSKDDPVLGAYLFHLRNDPVSEVRQAVLMVLEVSKETIEDIIIRTRDAKDIVRKTAFVKLAEQVDVRIFSIEQRLNLLKIGLNDRNPSVRKVVETKLIDAWLKSYENNLIDLLVDLDIQSDVVTVEKMVLTIFHQFLDNELPNNSTSFHKYVEAFCEAMLDERKLMTKRPLTVEGAFLWRCVIKFLKDNEERLIRVLPEETSRQEIEAEIDEMLAGVDIRRVVDSEGSQEESPMDTNATPSSEMESQSQSNTPEERETSEDSQMESAPPEKPAPSVDFVDQVITQLPHLCNYLSKSDIDHLIHHHKNIISRFAKKIDATDFSMEELLDFQFMYAQLMEILLMFEIGDEVQKKMILDLLQTILFADTLPVKFEDHISPIMKIVAENVFKDKSELLEFAAEVTNKIYNSLEEVEDSRSQNERQFDPALVREYEMRYAKLTVEYQEMRDKMEEALSSEDYKEAQLIKERIAVLSKEREEVQNQRLNASCAPSSSQQQKTLNLSEHPVALTKCLLVFSGCLEFGKFTSINGIILSHVERIILNHDTESVKVAALKCIFDFLCQHGIRILADSPDSEKSNPKPAQPDVVDRDPFAELLEGGSHEGDKDTDSGGKSGEEFFESSVSSGERTIDEEQNRIMEELNKDETTEEDVMKLMTELLVDQLKSSSDEIRLITSQGVGKLLFLGRLYSPNLLTRLITLWYDPELQEETKQFIGVFFSMYSSAQTKYSSQLTVQTALEECFMETITSVYKAKQKIANFDVSQDSNDFDEDQVAEINFENLISFMVNLIADENHPNIAIMVCQKMLSLLQLDDNKFFVMSDLLTKHLTKVLSQLCFNDVSRGQLSELTVLMSKIGELMTRRCPNLPTAVTKRLEKVNSKLDSFHFDRSLIDAGDE